MARKSKASATSKPKKASPAKKGTAKATTKAAKAAKAQTPKPAAAANSGDATQTVTVRMLKQYTKRFVFENRGAIVPVQQGADTQVDVQVNVNVGANRIANNDYEVGLQMTATAKRGEQDMYVADLVYAAIFRMENVPEQNVNPILLIEGPRLIFPFARKILAEATAEGGYQSLMLEPINFADLFAQSQQQAQQQNGGTGGAGGEALPNL